MKLVVVVEELGIVLLAKVTVGLTKELIIDYNKRIKTILRYRLLLRYSISHKQTNNKLRSCAMHETIYVINIKYQLI